MAKLAKTPDGLFKKVDVDEFAWHPETAQHRANMRGNPVGSLGRMVEKPTWNNEMQKFEGGKIVGGTVKLPEQWKYKRADELADRMQKPVASAFKLDKKKYPDVEETPYGFIYNVNGKSITDAKAQNEKFGMNGGKGFTLTEGGDEVYYETFDDAYKAAKGGK